MFENHLVVVVLIRAPAERLAVTGVPDGPRVYDCEPGLSARRFAGSVPVRSIDCLGPRLAIAETGGVVLRKLHLCGRPGIGIDDWRAEREQPQHDRAGLGDFLCLLVAREVFARKCLVWPFLPPNSMKKLA